MNKYNAANLSFWLAEEKHREIRNLPSPLHVHFLLTGSDGQVCQNNKRFPQTALQQMHSELEPSSRLR